MSSDLSNLFSLFPQLIILMLIQQVVFSEGTNEWFLFSTLVPFILVSGFK